MLELWKRRRVYRVEFLISKKALANAWHLVLGSNGHEEFIYLHMADKIIFIRGMCLLHKEKRCLTLLRQSNSKNFSCLSNAPIWWKNKTLLRVCSRQSPHVEWKRLMYVKENSSKVGRTIQCISKVNEFCVRFIPRGCLRLTFRHSRITHKYIRYEIHLYHDIRLESVQTNSRVL